MAKRAQTSAAVRAVKRIITNESYFTSSKAVDGGDCHLCAGRDPSKETIAALNEIENGGGLEFSSKEEFRRWLYS